MRRTILWMLMLLALTTRAQRTVVSGLVTDATNGEPLAGASVTMDSLQVVTNDDGYFTLKSDALGQTLTVTHVGYRSQRINVATAGRAGTPAEAQQVRVRLQPASIALQEVLVTTENARDLVRSAIRLIPRNYSTKAELHQCFYREMVMKRQNYISVAEGVIDMYKTDYRRGAGRDRVAISKGRRLLSPKRSDTVSVKVMGGPVTALQLDVVKNTEFLLNNEELDLYDMKMEQPTTIGDRAQYVVSISPRVVMPYALYYGRLYIDQQTRAFTRAELSLDMSDRAKATNMMLVKKPATLRFKPKELSCVVDYRLCDDGMTRISYVRTTFRFNCDWRRRLFATSFAAFCEMAVTSTADGEARPIQGRASFDQRDAFFDKVDYFLDPAFWQDYNIIEPTESLDKAVGKLLKKHGVEKNGKMRK